MAAAIMAVGFCPKPPNAAQARPLNGAGVELRAVISATTLSGNYDRQDLGDEDMNQQTELSVIPMETIREMGKLIGERFHPEKVILFGSYARGEGGINSDVDLMIVMESSAPRFERSVPIRSALSEHWIEPIDVIVRSPEVLDRNKDIPGTLEYEAIRDGVVLYEKRI